MTEQKGSSFYDKFEPKVAFFLGLGGGLAIIFTIGFFVLLYVILSGNDINILSRNSNSTKNTNKAAAVNTNTSVPQITVVPVSSKDWVRGDRNAKVSIIEYSDIECPFCSRNHSIMKQVLEKYNGQVNWVFRHFPLVSLHPNAPKDAEAVECAGELGGNDMFWKLLDKLFETASAKNGVPPEELPDLAAQVGMKKEDFKKCLDSGKYASKVQASEEEAINAGAQGTPYSVIVSGSKNLPVTGGAIPLTELSPMIDQMLK